jgi:hypothetical protein
MRDARCQSTGAASPGPDPPPPAPRSARTPPRGQGVEGEPEEEGVEDALRVERHHVEGEPERGGRRRGRAPAMAEVPWELSPPRGTGNRRPRAGRRQPSAACVHQRRASPPSSPHRHGGPEHVPRGASPPLASPVPSPWPVGGRTRAARTRRLVARHELLPGPRREDRGAPHPPQHAAVVLERTAHPERLPTGPAPVHPTPHPAPAAPPRRPLMSFT